MNKLLILVVTYNGLKDIDKCLSSIDVTNNEIQGLIIDNGSSDSTAMKIKYSYPSLKLIENSKNLGFGAANNIGLKYAIEMDFEYVYLLNQDAWIHPEEISKLIDIADRNQNYAILSPLHVFEGQKEMDKSFGKSITDEIKDDFILGMNEKKDLYEIKDKHIPAAHWLIRTNALKTIGLFSPSFFHYAEDDNFIDRTLYHGFKIGISPQVIGIHNRKDRIVNNRMYLYLMREQWVRILSNPNKSVRNAIKGVSTEFYKLLVNKGFSSFTLLFNVIRRYKQIIKNRKISLGERAFLDNF